MHKARATWRRTNRGALPTHMLQIEAMVDVSSTVCPCRAGALHRIGEDISDRLDVVPAQFRYRWFVVQILVSKFADLTKNRSKANHSWTNDQVERMNRTIKEATAQRYYYETHDQLRGHLANFATAYNFAKGYCPPQRQWAGHAGLGRPMCGLRISDDPQYRKGRNLPLLQLLEGNEAGQDRLCRPAS